MPNRILRDWCDSEPVNSLEPWAERTFTRLIMKADDYGRGRAEAKQLRPLLYPLLLEVVREADLERWIAECEIAGLVRLYVVGGKRYFEIVNFKQRSRSPSKFPDPPNDGHVTVTCQSTDGHMLTEAHALSNAETKAQGSLDGPGESADGDKLDAQVRKYLTDHPMLTGWNRRDAGDLRAGVEKFGWDWVKEMVEKGVSKHVDAMNYLRGCVRVEKQKKATEMVALEASMNIKPVSRKFHS